MDWLDRLDAMEKAATPGRWRALTGEVGEMSGIAADVELDSPGTRRIGGVFEDEEDETLVAALRNLAADGRLTEVLRAAQMVVDHEPGTLKLRAGRNRLRAALTALQESIDE